MFRILQFYRSIIQGVAFVPLIVSIVLTCVALFLTLSPGVSSFNSFVYSGGYFEVRTSETARAVLTSILTGMVSLTVFGFSMMMIVVNQAASNYSPKVVETLTGQRSNQYILGVNLGTIIFSLIVMMHIDNKKADGGIPELAILANMLLAIYCLFLFVRFTNNIANSVRINNIIKMIFKKTKHRIDQMESSDRHSGEGDTAGWTLYSAQHSGYFQLLRSRPVIAILSKHNVKLKVLPRVGEYYLRHEPLFMLSRKLDEDVVNNIRSEFVTYYGETVDQNLFYGFRQLREIAVKALSPGINDPGVALLCIEHLSELLSLVVGHKKEYYLSDSEGHARIYLADYDFASLLELSLLPIRYYGRRDYIILDALLLTVYQIALSDPEKQAAVALNEFSRSVVDGAFGDIEDPLQRRVLNRRIAQMNGSDYFDLPLLKAPSHV